MVNNLTYYEFMLQFVEDNNYVGDLARDIKEDKNFPRKSTSKTEIESYFSSTSEIIEETLNEYFNKSK
ncbi:hypothetical protein FM106_05910 [Brachybacterium faecium]|nr:hypothetical protein FM106_05910 [Brachybacterium faecium]